MIESLYLIENLNGGPSAEKYIVLHRMGGDGTDAVLHKRIMRLMGIYKLARPYFVL
jgi:hypothetical protein